MPPFRSHEVLRTRGPNPGFCLGEYFLLDRTVHYHKLVLKPFDLGYFARSTSDFHFEILGYEMASSYRDDY